MRAVVEIPCPRSLSRAVVLLTLGLGAAGCSSDVNRFHENPLGSPYAARPAAGEVTGSVPAAQPAPVRQVESRPLGQPSAQALPPPPAVGRPGTVAGGGVSGGGRGMASYQPSAAPMPAPHAADITGTVPSTPRLAPPPRPAPTPAAANWNWEGGTAITVAPGETLATISHRYGVPVSAIVQSNGLTQPAALQPGQRLVIPRYNYGSQAGAPAPQPVAAQSAAMPQAPLSSVHVVAPGETLVGIAHRYGKTVVELAAANKIPPHTMLKMGDRIIIPGKLGQRVQATTPVAPQLMAPRAQAPAPAPLSQVASAEPTAAVRVAAPVVDPHEEERPSNGMTPAFRWPVKGRVITGFGSKTSGQQNDGINLSVPEGTAVRAAEDGVVAYAGSELKGYGNLILIRHANGFVTAYAHASEIMVKRNDQVRRGQVIAKSGQTGTVTSPQLHFEIRKGSAPVDPMQFLPAGA